MEPLYQKVEISANHSIHIKKTFNTLFHFHPEYELIYFYEGSGKCIIGDKITTYKAGDLFFLGPDLPHCFTPGHDQVQIGSGSIVIQLEKNIFKATISKYPELASIKYLFESAKRGLLFYGKTSQKASLKIASLNGLDDFYQLIEVLVVLRNLSQSDEYQALSNPGYVPKLKRKNYDRINEVYAYVDQQFQHKIKLGEVSTLLHMTPSAFCRYFKKITRRTFINYLNEYRVGYACKRLIRDDLSISEVCFESGFDSIANFNKQFKYYTALSPMAYRKRYKEYAYTAFSDRKNSKGKAQK